MNISDCHTTVQGVKVSSPRPDQCPQLNLKKISYVHVPQEIRIVEGSLLIMNIEFILSTCSIFFRTYTSTLLRYCLYKPIQPIQTISTLTVA